MQNDLFGVEIKNIDGAKFALDKQNLQTEGASGLASGDVDVGQVCEGRKIAKALRL